MTKTGKVASQKLQADWEAVLRGDRAAFQATVSPYLGELFEAARRELRYHIALGDLAADDLTADELVGEVLVRAWHDRHRRPPLLGVKTWVLALLFRVAEDIVRREVRFKELTAVSLEARVPPGPIYDDDESFWEWYQPDELTRWEDVVSGSSMTPEEMAAADEERIRSLAPRTREVFIMREIHHVPLREVALALGISVSEVSRFLSDALRHVDAPKGKTAS